MVDVDKVLDDAGLSNEAVRDYVKHWAEHLQPDRIEVVSAADDSRLIEEALAAGEIQPAGEGLYYSRSYSKDTARSEERTIVATSREEDKGVYNNWRHSDEIRPIVEGHMKGAFAGKTMYVIPYLMAPPGSPLEKYAAGVEITDNRTVCLHMIRMARVGIDLINNLAEPDHFVRAVHVTGDLPNLGQGTPEDKRYFVTVADERTILHFGSSYGGNALLGKIAHGLRQAAYDGWRSREFLSEQFMLLGIKDKETGKEWHVCGGFPSACGKTNLAMIDPTLEGWSAEMVGDDIAWLWVDPDSGELLGLNPENGVFGVAKDTNEKTNPTALDSIEPGSQALFTNVAYNDQTHEVWWEGMTEQPPAHLTDWKGRDWTPDNGELSSHPNSRFCTPAKQCPMMAAEYDEPNGVPIDAILFGGRRKTTVPLVYETRDWNHGVFVGATLSSETTAAAVGQVGVVRRDPMAMLPFIGYNAADYVGHWLEIGKQADASKLPKIYQVNWFRRDVNEDGTAGKFLWPGYRENLRALLWLCQFKDGEVTGRQTAVGVIPTEDELGMEGLDLPQADLDRILDIDIARWREEMGHRQEHLEQFPNLPEEIWVAHRRVAEALDQA